ncbi:MAG: NAD(P)-dependent oxidoreductase [Candidatus Diapherotrites archaeon]|nr:NAD(P)-dependent oxidoreductase [Candidatus Diapherotrites archaeon]
MNVLVTGSSGMIGKMLCAELRGKGHRVRGFSRREGCDILKKEDCEKAVKGADAVYHCAAILEEDDSRLFDVNVKGTENLLEASAKARIRHFVFLSSVGVYGNSEEKLGEDSAFAPATPYEKSKAEAEKTVQTYLEVLPITIVRPPIVIGPNSYWRRIIKLIEDGFPIVGGGNNKWQTIYVKDLVSFLVFILGKDEVIGETYVVAGQDAPTLKELCEIVKREKKSAKKNPSVPFAVGMLVGTISDIASRITGKKSLVGKHNIVRLVKNRHYDISKALALGWKPEYSTEQALHETIASFNQQA